MKNLMVIPLILGLALSACQSMPTSTSSKTLQEVYSGDTENIIQLSKQASGTKADTNAVELVSVNDNGVDTDVEALLTAERTKESLDQANRTDPDVGQAFAALDKEFEGRIAGSYIKREPTYTYVLQLKGSGKDTTRMIKIFDVNDPKKFELVPIEIKYEAKFTEKEARVQQSAAVEFLRGYFPSNLLIVGYNPETLMIDADVKGKPTPENLALVEAVKTNWGKDKLPIQINFVSYSIGPF